MDLGQREAIVRRSIDGWNADEWEEGLNSVWRPDGVIVSPGGWPEAGTFMTYFLDREAAREAAVRGHS